jgi:hypothetical protein
MEKRNSSAILKWHFKSADFKIPKKTPCFDRKKMVSYPLVGKHRFANWLFVNRPFTNIRGDLEK